MIDQKITIIGGGNLGGAVAFGLIKSKQIQPSALTISDRYPIVLKKFQEQGATTTDNNIEAVKNADIIILAIKPYQANDILAEIKPFLSSNQILISAVAGLGLPKLEEAVSGSGVHTFRIMPNTAIAIQESMKIGRAHV